MCRKSNKILLVEMMCVLRNHFFLSVSLLVMLVIIVGCQPEQESIMESIPTDIVYSEHSNIVRLANGYWPPYNGKLLPEGGCDSQVIMETFALAGYEVEYGYFPWVRSYSLSATGEWDGTLAWDDTPSIQGEHWASAKPTSVQEWVFFYRKADNFSWNSLNDLQGKIIGITTGYKYSDTFVNLPEDSFTFLNSNSDETNLKMLVAGHIDVFPIEKNVGLYLIRQGFSEEEQNMITYDEKAISEFNSYLLLSKAIPENEQRIKEFDQAFRKLIESGRYEKIMAQCIQGEE